jgi:hypothetical protein
MPSRVEPLSELEYRENRARRSNDVWPFSTLRFVGESRRVSDPTVERFDTDVAVRILNSANRALVVDLGAGINHRAILQVSTLQIAADYGTRRNPGATSVSPRRAPPSS